MKLTETQIDFIYDRFFREENYAGSKNIAYELLRKGKCIVAGDVRIWNGGIGNFISISEAEGTVGCSLYEFDLGSFLSWAMFKDVVAVEVQKNKTDIIIAERNIENLEELTLVL